MSPNQLESLAGVIDVEDLMTRCLGNIEFAEKILAVFQTRCEADLVELEEAATAGDMGRIEKLAHRLKGACANAGASRLSTRASELWTAAHQKATAEIPSKLMTLRTAWDECAQNFPSATPVAVTA